MTEENTPPVTDDHAQVRLAKISFKKTVVATIITSITAIVGVVIPIALTEPPAEPENEPELNESYNPNEFDTLGHANATPPPEQHWIHIHGGRIIGFDDSLNDDVRIIFDVNGQTYSTPSTTVWSGLNEDEPNERFPLPIDIQESATINFRAIAFLSNMTRTFHAKEAIVVSTVPYEGIVELVGYNAESRDNSGSGQQLLVRFSVQ